MESRIVVTYKRKRLFSRRDHSHINLHSDKPLEISESKSLANANKNEGPITEPMLQKKDKEFEIRHEHVKDKDGESLARCENCGTQTSSQCSERATKRQKLCSSCTKQQDSSESCHIDSSSQRHAEEKLNDTHENMSKETFSDELHKDQCINLNAPKTKLGSTLITFSRRSKRNRAIAAQDIASRSDITCSSEKLVASSGSVDMKNEKVATLASPFIDNDKDCREKKPFVQGQVCKDAQDNYHVNQLDVKPQGSLIEDLNTQKVPSDVPEKKSSPSSLDLSISPRAARDIDCNLPLDCGSDENHLSGPPEVVPNALCSTSKINENMPTLQLGPAENGSLVGPIGDKGKSPIDPLPVLTGTSSNNNYLQLFPENSTHNAPGLANDPQKSTFLTGPQERVQSDPKRNSHHPCYSTSYGWPHINLQPREAFQDFLHSTSQPFSRQKMMLDTILNRARAVRANGAYLSKFESLTTTWSEEELDCLWIGVRRHGKGNWDAILRDQRLNFFPWKTSRDLADRWREEQYKLVYGPQFSQVKYASTSNFTNIHTNIHLQKPSESSIDTCPKGSLPHWLREAVETRPEQWGPSQSLVSSVCHPGTSHHHGLNNRCLNIQRRKNKPHNDRWVNKEDLIVITSDASSEETISDDRSVKI